MLDDEGVEQYRTLGFFPPEELIPSLLLGMGKTKFNLPNRPAACEYFSKVVAQCPKSSLAPEAIYLNGVSSYIESHDVANLIGIYDRLADQGRSLQVADKRREEGQIMSVVRN